MKMILAKLNVAEMFEKMLSSLYVEMNYTILKQIKRLRTFLNLSIKFSLFLTKQNFLFNEKFSENAKLQEFFLQEKFQTLRLLEQEDMNNKIKNF